MKTLLTILAALAMINTCQAATPAQAQQLHWRIQAQQDRLDQLEEDIEAERRRIQQWYQSQLADLQLAAEREARMLLAPERVLMTALLTKTADAPLLVRRLSVYSPSDGRWFFTPSDGRYVPETVSIFHRGSHVGTNKGRVARRLFDALEHRYFLNSMRALLLDNHFRKLLLDIADKNEVKDVDSNLLRAEARRLLAVMDTLSREMQYIEKVRDARLAALEEDKQTRMANVRQVISEIKAEPVAAETGRIAAICLNDLGSFCMIEGVDGLVRKGSTIDGRIKVQNIAEDKVTFVAAGNSWQQKVGQAPSDRWN